MKLCEDPNRTRIPQNSTLPTTQNALHRDDEFPVSVLPRKLSPSTADKNNPDPTFQDTTTQKTSAGHEEVMIDLDIAGKWH